jgi:hypothetical protein
MGGLKICSEALGRDGLSRRGAAGTSRARHDNLDDDNAPTAIVHWTFAVIPSTLGRSSLAFSTQTALKTMRLLRNAFFGRMSSGGQWDG